MTLPPNSYKREDSPQDQEESPESDDTEHYNVAPNNEATGIIHTNKAVSEQDPSREMDIFSFHMGQVIDVLDSVDRWSEAEVLKIDHDSNRIYVSFLYWQSKWDVWVDNIAERTAPLHTHTYYPSGPLKVGQRISVLDTKGVWLEAFVIDEQRDAVLIHYRNYSPSFDEWIPRVDTHRFRQFGPDKKLKAKKKLWSVPSLREEDVDNDVHRFIAYNQAQNQRNINHGQDYEQYDYNHSHTRPSSGSSERKPGSKDSPRHHKHIKSVNDSSVDNQERRRQITEFSERYLHYIHALEEQNLEVHPVEGDGNCMFRAVAHQVYGEERFHSLVREKCMDYMESQAEFFSQFVVGGMQTFPLYVAAKRQDGCWGDDPEIQALCEMYGRPAYIWAYDAQRGAKNLRTFHEAAHMQSQSGGGVIRLSYYGGGHYDSIHKFGTFDSKPVSNQNNNQEKPSNREPRNRDIFIRTQPGVIEESAIQRVTQRQRQQQQQTSDTTSNMPAATALANSVLAQELALVAEAKRVSEQEASDMDLDMAIRASRHDITYWEEQDVESCLLDSIAMSKAEEKSTSSSSRPSSKSSSRIPANTTSNGSPNTSIRASQGSSAGFDIEINTGATASSPRRDNSKRQKMESPLPIFTPRSESKTSSSASAGVEQGEWKSAKTQVEEEEAILAESLRVHEEQQLQAARELSLSMSRECGTGGSEEELLKQAMQASLNESYQQQYEGQQYDELILQSHLKEGDEECLRLMDDEESDEALQQALAMSLEEEAGGVREKDKSSGCSSNGSKSGDLTESSGVTEEGRVNTQTTFHHSRAPPPESSFATTTPTASQQTPADEAGVDKFMNSSAASMLIFDNEEDDPELALALQFSMQER